MGICRIELVPGEAKPACPVMGQKAVEPMGRTVQRPPEVEKNRSHSPPLLKFTSIPAAFATNRETKSRSQPPMPFAPVPMNVDLKSQPPMPFAAVPMNVDLKVNPRLGACYIDSAVRIL
jgi:hypothetical protein